MSSLPPPDLEAVPHRRASFGERLLGLVLDLVLYSLAASILVVPGVFLGVAAVRDCTHTRVHGRRHITCAPGELRGGMLFAGIALAAVGIVAVAIVYLLALGRTGQTWGRRIAGVQVVGKSTGRPLGVGRAVGRQLLEQLLSANCVLGYLWMLWDKDQQTWHDKLIDSVVIKV